jgi:hypothetical protein
MGKEEEELTMRIVTVFFPDPELDFEVPLGKGAPGRALCSRPALLDKMARILLDGVIHFRKSLVRVVEPVQHDEQVVLESEDESTTTADIGMSGPFGEESNCSFVR